MSYALTFDAFNAANRRRSLESFPQCESWTAADWLVALTGEVGELANLFKKRRRGDEVLDQDLRHEAADVLTYAFILAERLGFDPAAIAAEKFNVISRRVGSSFFLPEREEVDGSAWSGLVTPCLECGQDSAAPGDDRCDRCRMPL